MDAARHGLSLRMALAKPVVTWSHWRRKRLDQASGDNLRASRPPGDGAGKPNKKQKKNQKKTKTQTKKKKK